MTKEEAKTILASCFIGVILALLVVIIAEQQRELERIPKEVTKTVTVTEEVIVKEIEELIVDNNTYQYDIPLESEVLDFIQVFSDYYKIPIPLILAIIQTESSYIATNKSVTNDHGLMQIHEPYFKFYIELDDTLIQTYNLPLDIYHPLTNIIAGCNAYKFWESEAVKYNSYKIKDVLNMYNKGYKYLETKDTTYSDKVIGNLKEILGVKTLTINN